METTTEVGQLPNKYRRLENRTEFSYGIRFTMVGYNIQASYRDVCVYVCVGGGGGGGGVEREWGSRHHLAWEVNISPSFQLLFS